MERDVLEIIHQNSLNVSFPDPKPSDQDAANRKTLYFHS